MAKSEKELLKIQKNYVNDIWEYHKDELKEAFGEDFEKEDITASKLLDLNMDGYEDLCFMAGYLYRIKEELEERQK
jgi:hypothetical protein